MCYSFLITKVINLNILTKLRRLIFFIISGRGEFGEVRLARLAAPCEQGASSPGKEPDTLVMVKVNSYKLL